MRRGFTGRLLPLRSSAAEGMAQLESARRPDRLRPPPRNSRTGRPGRARAPPRRALHAALEPPAAASRRSLPRLGCPPLLILPSVVAASPRVAVFRRRRRLNPRSLPGEQHYRFGRKQVGASMPSTATRSPRPAAAAHTAAPGSRGRDAPEPKSRARTAPRLAALPGRGRRPPSAR